MQNMIANYIDQFFQNHSEQDELWIVCVGTRVTNIWITIFCMFFFVYIAFMLQIDNTTSSVNDT